MSLREDILACLEEAGFRTGAGPLTPLGQPLPLVTGWAISGDTGTLALIAQAEPEWDNDAWRELFFALASLRHELRHGRRSAFGTPVTLAVLQNEEEAQRLRELAEDLSRDYLLFTRLELNLIVERADVDVELALAPLLPRCRRAIRDGALVGAEALAQLAGEIREEIAAASDQLEDPTLRAVAQPIAKDVADHIAALVEVDLSTRPRPDPIARIKLSGFRVFDEEDLELAPFTLLEGLNGTGKSSIIEALQIAWTGSSPRRPSKVTAADFDRHLQREGNRPWKIEVWRSRNEDPDEVASTSQERPRLGLGRTVFAADSARDIASDAPEERYAEFLRMVGLEVPELRRTSEELRQSAKQGLNAVLERLGIAPVARVDTPAARHVRQHLARPISLDKSPWNAVDDAAEALSMAAQAEALSFRLPLSLETSEDSRLSELAQLAKALAPTLTTSSEYVTLARQFAGDFELWAKQADEYATSLDLLLARGSELDVAAPLTEEAPSFSEPSLPPPLPSDVTRAWLYGARALRQATEELERRADSVTNAEWRGRLETFLARSHAALEAVPTDELEAAQGRSASMPSRPARHGSLDPELLRAAGLSEVSLRELPTSLTDPMSVLRNAMRGLAAAQKELARSLVGSALSRLDGLENELQSAVARSELVRQLQEPLERAQQKVLDSLFGDRLRDILVELIMALTRFEWYFHPPRIAVQGKAVSIGGMATDSPDLDIRMLLNAGERSIVALAWFLSLHLLQPDRDRRTLILDDPFSYLDSTNEAAAIATIRSILRMTRPELFIFSCHDQALADTLAEEFAEFSGWPIGRARYRFAREATGSASATVVPEGDGTADLEGELNRVGLSSATSQ